MEIYLENRKRHKEATRVWETKLKPEQNQQGPKEWVIGNRTHQKRIIILVDSSWKVKCRKNEWQAAIAWTSQQGNTINTRSERIFAISPLQTEARVILQATKDLQWRCADDIQIKTDCIEIIQALQNLEQYNKDIYHIIKEIQSLAKTFQQFKCTKASRAEI